MDVVDKVEALPTVQNNQPANLAIIQSISIKKRWSSHRQLLYFLFMIN